MDNPDAMRALLILAVLAATASARGKQHQDEVNPRAPDQPLEIPYLDYYCPTCVEEARIAPPEKKPDVRFMRMSVSKFSKDLGFKERDLGKNWFYIQTPEFKILTNLKGAKVKPQDSTFITFDLRRLKKIFPKLTIGLQGTVLRPHQRATSNHDSAGIRPGACQWLLSRSSITARRRRRSWVGQLATRVAPTSTMASPSLTRLETEIKSANRRPTPARAQAR